MNNNNAAVELVHVVNPSGGSGESYTAGAGITISDQNEIGIDQSVVATKAYVTQEIGTVREVPEASSADSGKVLGVTDSEGTLGWVANGGGSSYTAGTGIDITSDTISVDTSVIATQNDISGLQGALTAGTGIDITNDTISIDNTVALKTDIPAKGSLMVKNGTTQKELYDAWAAGWTIQSNHGNEINVYELTKFDYDFGEYTATFSLITFSETTVSETSFVISGIASSTSAVSFGTTTRKRTNRVPDASSQTVGKVLTIKSVPDEDPIASWETPASVDEVPAVTSSDDGKVLTATYSGGTGSYAWATPSGGTTYTAGNGIDITSGTISVDTTVVATQTDIGNVRQVPSSTSADEGKVLGVTDSQGTLGWVSQPADELPSISGNSNKVLKVNAGGTAVEWATESAGTTYTAGNMISLANDAVAVSTTAGITDIQLVNALPASPVATVLYLIPET